MKYSTHIRVPADDRCGSKCIVVSSTTGNWSDCPHVAEWVRQAVGQLTEENRCNVQW